MWGALLPRRAAVPACRFVLALALVSTSVHLTTDNDPTAGFRRSKHRARVRQVAAKRRGHGSTALAVCPGHATENTTRRTKHGCSDTPHRLTLDTPRPRPAKPLSRGPPQGRRGRQPVRARPGAPSPSGDYRPANSPNLSAIAASRPAAVCWYRRAMTGVACPNRSISSFVVAPA